MPYDVVLGRFTGDWSNAADLYKPWALSQQWAKRAETEKKTPAWLFDTAVAADYSVVGWGGRDPRWKQQDEVVKAFKHNVSNAQRHQDYFSLPSVFDVYGWERGGIWASGDYFPALGDWAKFDDLVADLHRLGARIWLYIDSAAMTVSAPAWTTGEAEPFTLHDKSGKPVVRDDTDAGYPEPHAMMDVATSYWQGKLREYFVTMAQHGADQIQIDGFPWRPPSASYDTKHGHPVGLGGNWYTQAWLKTLDDLRRAVREVNPDIVLSSEGIAEVFLPYVDIFDSRDTHQTEELEPGGTQVPVPLFTYVYGHRVLMASHKWDAIEKYGVGMPFNQLGFSRAFTWQGLPTYQGLHLQDPQNSPKLDLVTLEYIRRIAQARETYLKPLLQQGEMVRPLRLAAPSTTVVLNLAGKQYPLQVPAIQHSVWRSADGALAFLFTNISDTPVSIPFPTNLEQYGIAKTGKYRATIWADGKALTPPLPLQGDFEILVNPLAIVAVIIAPER